MPRDKMLYKKEVFSRDILAALYAPKRSHLRCPLLESTRALIEEQVSSTDGLVALRGKLVIDAYERN